MAGGSSACFALLAIVALSRGHEFLKAVPKELKERISEEDIRSSLLEEVEGTLGSGAASHRLRLLEATLKPMYDALPKNEHGNLDHSAVRYALHRLFILRHGWSIKGLARDSTEAELSSPAGILKDQVPAYIQSTFEQRLGDTGLGLHELAIMASTLEHLIHKEAVGRLGDVYSIYNLLPSSMVRESTGFELLDTYMMAFILGESLGNLTAYDARHIIGEMPELYLAWKDTQTFVRRIHSNITQTSVGSSSQLSFSTLAKVIEVVGEEFGSFQDVECRQLKDKLMKMESGATGRVKISDFYKPALGGGWQFQESLGYLRQLGALDESDPNSTSVIIVNYLHSQTNCIASSGYYSVCCKDECESLFGQLEEKIAAPEATPSTIVSIVEAMASSTVKSSRQISAKMKTHLADIAALHGGMVPLHGRLFAQWMHHAYPRECPYPHISGTTRQQTADEWLLETGTDSVATEAEVRDLARESAAVATESDEIDMPWSQEEELFVCRQPKAVASESPYKSLRPLVLVLLAGLLAIGFKQSFKSAVAGSYDAKGEKFVV
jgi:hypothetical protein|mmetsp:Transcript_39519/g.62758  ORF Transcript_39519/g.62758 Transcript_39519/m.62758 type:complete len:552 (-) Transcript_39519:58-1713(-)